MQWTHSNASEVCLVIARLRGSSAIDQDSKSQRCPRAGTRRARSLVVGARAPQRCQGLRRRRRRGEVAVPRGNGQGCARSASFSRGGWSWSVPGKPPFPSTTKTRTFFEEGSSSRASSNIRRPILCWWSTKRRAPKPHVPDMPRRPSFAVPPRGNGSAEDVLDHYGAHRIVLGGHPGGVRRQVARTFSLFLRI